MRMPTTLGLSLALLVAPPAAMAKQHASAHHHAAPSVKLNASPPPPRTRSAKKTAVAKRVGTRRERERAAQRPRSIAQYPGMQYPGVQYAGSSLPSPDQYIAPATVTGQGQVGRAAWYGNRHIGCAHRVRRTARRGIRDRSASLAAAEFAGAGHESAQWPLGGRADQRSRPGQPLAVDRYVPARRRGHRYDPQGDRRRHDPAGDRPPTASARPRADRHRPRSAPAPTGVAIHGKTLGFTGCRLSATVAEKARRASKSRRGAQAAIDSKSVVDCTICPVPCVPTVSIRIYRK